MSKYAFLFLDDGVDYQGAPTPEQQKVYADIFKWFETNGSKITDGGAELQPTRTATTIRRPRAGSWQRSSRPATAGRRSAGSPRRRS